MKRVEGGRLFPPPLGWAPVGLGLLAVVIMAIWSVSPQFGTKILGAQTGAGANGPGAAANGPANPGDNGAAAGNANAAGGTGSGGPVAAANGAAGGSKAAPAGLQCAAGKNGGSTAPGVSGSEIHVASTIVTTGVGQGFLGEAVSGMQAAINEANNAGGVCGRRITMDTLNDGWNGPTGAQYINNWINSGNVFALVGEPDSEGLDQAITSQAIDRAGMPVVGTDGMLKSQYHDQWVWPVAASTVTNMHVIAKYMVDHGAQSFGIVFDTSYKFGAEGANAFDQEIKRLTGKDIPGYDPSLKQCQAQFCGIPSNLENGQNTGYGSYITQFNQSCATSSGKAKCDAVVMLLEPQPMEAWMRGEENCNCNWYNQLIGGEPLFDDKLAGQCGGSCASMMVWTGYHPSIQPFDAEGAVSSFAQSLKAVCPSCDTQNEFTEGAYLGTKLFIAACKAAGPYLTRQTLKDALDSQTFDLGLASGPLHYGTASSHLANTAMAAFGDNAPKNGSFNGWNYLQTGFIRDPAPGQDMG